MYIGLLLVLLLRRGKGHTVQTEKEVCYYYYEKKNFLIEVATMIYRLHFYLILNLHENLAARVLFALSLFFTVPQVCHLRFPLELGLTNNCIIKYCHRVYGRVKFHDRFV